MVKVPLGVLADFSNRRSKKAVFTCNKCGGRSEKLVNPLAWEKGLVLAQCDHCKVWHTLASNDPKLFEEVRYTKDKGSEVEPP